MAETFHYRSPNDAGWFLRRLRDDGVQWEDSGVLENLFSAERTKACDEAVFLEDGSGNVLALAIIAKTDPAVWSYYTVPKHRGKRCGYRLLVHCLERILEGLSDPKSKVLIEPISDESRKHVNNLPPHLRIRVSVRE